MTERTEDAQSQAVRAFLLLCALQESWPGNLVLVRGLDAEGRAVSVAATIAGAACLALDSRADICRATLRAGACDFVVNSVDEALRILKNEIRKRKPVSVIVATPETAALHELVERGVAPAAYILTSAGEPDATELRFAQFGARLVSMSSAGDAESSVAGILDGYLRGRDLIRREFEFSTPQELREFDLRLASVIPASDPRHRWIALAPGFFHRERPHRRVAYLTASELAQLS